MASIKTQTPKPAASAGPSVQSVGQNIDVKAGQTISVQAPGSLAIGHDGKPKIADGQAALLALLKVESDARDAATESDLIFLIANETRKLTRARQIFVVMPGITSSYEVKGISSLPAVDRNAPLVIFIEQLVARNAPGDKLEQPATLDKSVVADAGILDSYPFQELVWVPLKHGSAAALGGVVLAREEAWGEADLVIGRRIASAYAHALRGLRGGRAVRRWKLSRWHAAGLFLALAALMFIKVPLSALAPAEIISRDPFVVAGPIDGVIEAIAVEPNQSVKTGMLLVKIADTALKNKFEVAAREVQVSEARLKQSNQIAFTDPRGLHEIGIARAELALKIAERDFARDLLAKTEIKAARDGLAVYSDKRDLVGRPVAIGERILEIADPEAIEAKIDLAVQDAMALAPGARVKIFLDSDPLRPWAAVVKRADYKAKVGENDVVSFRIVATLTLEDGRALPRLGVRGTAQVAGDDVPLALYLFRRPLTVARQWTGL